MKTHDVRLLRMKVKGHKELRSQDEIELDKIIDQFLEQKEKRKRRERPR